ncbi:MAG: hypothetical protein QM786_00450 [Breznakibacter sp.]
MICSPKHIKDFPYFFIGLFCLCAGTLKAQEPVTHEMKLLARPTPDSVMLRWAPASYQLWLVGNKYGYVVSRTCILRNNTYVENPRPEILTQKPLRPFPLEQWEALADKDDLAGVAAEAIYGDGFEVTTGDPGSLTELVNRATEQELRWGFALMAADQSRNVAQYSGLYWADKHVQKGEKYLYKVYPAAVPPGMQVDTAIFFTGTDEYLPVPSPVNVKAEAGDHVVTLTWERLAQEGLFSGFFVERSHDGGTSFRRLNQTLFVNTTPEGKDDLPFYYYADSLADNQTVYRYRVVGVTPFGETSPPSAVAMVRGIDQITLAPEIHRIGSPDNQTVEIAFALPRWKQEKIDGIRVLRSRDFDGQYTSLEPTLSMGDSLFVDPSPMPAAYYRLQAYNSQHTGPMGMPRFVQLVDSIPPSAPTGLSATADTTGLVQLSWTANPEPDMDGYRLYRANGPQEEFSLITPVAVRRTQYADTIELKTLTKKVYYKLTAIDKRQNRSAFSEVLTVDRPDIVPPAPPAMKAPGPLDNGIRLSWVPSSSNDVDHLLLYRSLSGQALWTLIAKLEPQSQTFADTTVISNTIYRYVAVAVDSTGNESAPTKPMAAKYSPAPKDLWITPQVKVDKKKGTVELKWNAATIPSSHVLLYGKNGTGQWRLIKRAPNSGLEKVSIEPGFNEFSIHVN